MVTQVQVVRDCADPGELAEFGRRWPARDADFARRVPLLAGISGALGVPKDQRDKASACLDPEGTGPRLYFQKMPEPKKSRTGCTSTSSQARAHPPRSDRRWPVPRKGAWSVSAPARSPVRRGPRALDRHAGPEVNEFCVSCGREEAAVTRDELRCSCLASPAPGTTSRERATASPRSSPSIGGRSVGVKCGRSRDEADACLR